jgi:hypothetical protein
MVVKERVEELAERESRNFRDLLSDFEKKTRELKKKEEEEYKGASNYLLSDARTERRVFSDTETMMYDTSSDDNSSEDKKTKPAPNLPPQPPKMSQATGPPIPKKSVSSIDSEDKYVPMTPPVSKSSLVSLASESTYLTMTPPKLSKKLMPSFSTSSPRASLTTSSTSGSIRSLHSRTPSQTLVMEHLQREFSDGARMITEEAYVDMAEKARPLFDSRRSESPRYCEIDESAHTTLNEDLEGSLSSAPSHYEYLYQARTASSQHYESVYQEIPEEEDIIRPMDRLPDILGNTPPVDVQCSRSHEDFEDETPRETPSTKMMMHASDTFRPASFFLDHSSQKHSKQKSSTKSQPEPAIVITPKSTLSKKNRAIVEQENLAKFEEVQKTGRPSSASSGLPPDKINLTYRSVYENETSDTDNKNSAASSGSLNRDTDGGSSGGGVPYYVSDLSSGQKSYEPESRSRPDSVRSRTPSYALDSDRDPSVARSKSLEGLLGDGHACQRDSVRVVVTPSITKNMTQHISAPSPTLSSYRSTPLPARGREPPPPPPCPPVSEDFRSWQYDVDDDDENRWRESLRRASAEHKARSSPFVRRSVPPNDPQQFNHSSIDQQQLNYPTNVQQFNHPMNERRSYSVCADPVDPHYMSHHNFLDRGLPEEIPPVSHSGRPHHPSTTDLPPYVSMPNIYSSPNTPVAPRSYFPSTPAPISGRRSVAASFAPESSSRTETALPDFHSLPQMGAHHQTSTPAPEGK